MLRQNLDALVVHHPAWVQLELLQFITQQTLNLMSEGIQSIHLEVGTQLQQVHHSSQPDQKALLVLVVVQELAEQSQCFPALEVYERQFLVDRVAQVSHHPRRLSPHHHIVLLHDVHELDHAVLIVEDHLGLMWAAPCYVGEYPASLLSDCVVWVVQVGINDWECPTFDQVRALIIIVGRKVPNKPESTDGTLVLPVEYKKVEYFGDSVSLHQHSTTLLGLLSQQGKSPHRTFDVVGVPLQVQFPDQSAQQGDHITQIFVVMVFLDMHEGGCHPRQNFQEFNRGLVAQDCGNLFDDMAGEQLLPVALTVSSQVPYCPEYLLEDSQLGAIHKLQQKLNATPLDQIVALVCVAG